MTSALLTLVLIGLAAVALLWGRRRLVPDAAALRVLARAGLTQRAGLALVELDGRRLLVGYGDGAPRVLLDDRPASAPAAEEVRP